MYEYVRELNEALSRLSRNLVITGRIDLAPTTEDFVVEVIMTNTMMSLQAHHMIEKLQNNLGKRTNFFGLLLLKRELAVLFLAMEGSQMRTQFCCDPVQWKLQRPPEMISMLHTLIEEIKIIY